MSNKNEKLVCYKYDARALTVEYLRRCGKICTPEEYLIEVLGLEAVYQTIIKDADSKKSLDVWKKLGQKD
ncbi:hypothetical protein ARAF_0827 [Arsenophonus endosymbiont of Aleurodicus floccissimus]|uniref:hypothetical protein n=1 Tax=Arsenophonus endosymbiont of Aleurodicus floccissimus TaxID=2152761 RepID=UPI000E6AEF5B|nr:hypothetical protein [Arsenophonus endosymbiont of Aleurodicus floccissimus]SPP31685.1 hypothetical protein ARAF_0827 [Arsenophonus endosymbiont of Aleurodicus floccissimus]